jgi:hypothetical protein
MAQQGRDGRYLALTANEGSEWGWQWRRVPALIRQRRQGYWLGMDVLGGRRVCHERAPGNLGTCIAIFLSERPIVNQGKR